MINKTIMIGRVGKDPELKTFEGGNKLASFSLATSESYKDNSGEWQTITEWHNIQVWGLAADRVSLNITKGNLLYIEGKITYKEYEDKNGVKKRATNINAKVFRKLEKSDSPTSTLPEPKKAEEMGVEANGDLRF